MEILSVLHLLTGMNNRNGMPQIDKVGVGLRLEALRHALGLSRKLFSESFGLDPSSYTRQSMARNS